MSEPMIVVKDVHKSFVLPHARVKSLKGKFVSIFQGSETYTSQHALKGLTFTVNKGDFFGIVGRNGSGKSTLLKIISNIYQPTKGSVNVRGTLMPFIELGVGFNPELTGRENVYLNGAIMGKPKKQIDKDYDAIVRFAELEEHMDKKLKNYSSGMQVRLAFACATMTDTDILVVDEVLAVGDADFQKKCFSYFKRIKNEGKTVILVTHDMSAVKEYCNRAILVENGKIVEQGSIDGVADAYSELFNPNTHEAVAQSRWGTGQVEIKRAKAFVSSSDKITIEVTCVANEAIQEELVLAYAVKSIGGVKLFGNKYPEKMNLKKGDVFDFTFEVENNLHKAKYLVDLSVYSPKNNVYLDCWIDCAEFKSSKVGVEGYAIIPQDRITVSKT